MWLEQEDCFDVIKVAWTWDGSTRGIQDLEAKLDAWKRSLIGWSKKNFKNNVMEIQKAKERLKTLSERRLNEVEEGEQRTLKS